MGISFISLRILNETPYRGEGFVAIDVDCHLYPSAIIFFVNFNISLAKIIVFNLSEIVTYRLCTMLRGFDFMQVGRLRYCLLWNCVMSSVQSKVSHYVNKEVGVGGWRGKCANVPYIINQPILVDDSYWFCWWYPILWIYGNMSVRDWPLSCNYHEWINTQILMRQ